MYLGGGGGGGGRGVRHPQFIVKIVFEMQKLRF